MRYAFGLVSLLVVSLIVVYLWVTSAKSTLDAAKPAQKQAQQISGRDENGAPATDSIDLEEYAPGGRQKGLRVTSVAPGGAMEKMYGLQKNDLIIGADSHGMMQSLTDSSARDAKAFLLQSYQEGRPIEIFRGGEKMKLPLPSAPGQSAPATADPLQKQLDRITRPQ